MDPHQYPDRLIYKATKTTNLKTTLDKLTVGEAATQASQMHNIKDIPKKDNSAHGNGT